MKESPDEQDPSSPQPPPESPRGGWELGWLRRGLTLLVATALIITFAVLALMLPVPYLVASPGVALNTLDEIDDEQIIRIEGRESYEHDDGGLAMVTVQYIGGPGHRIDLFTALSGWLQPTQAVLPEEAVFPPDQTMEEVSESQSLMMDSSQQLAVAAALNNLDIEFDQAPVVAAVPEDMPADGLLEDGDIITEVDGEDVDAQEEVSRRVQDRTAGDPVQITVTRDGESQELTVPTAADDDGQARIGIYLSSEMEFPFDVEISVGEIGGPSAGMMFALGVIDRLTEESITGDHYIAGTGTITAEGVVGGVSGIAQKMVSAEGQGAEYFFVAAESCAQTHESAAEDIEVVAIETLDDALDALETIRTDGDTADLPRCE